MARRRRERGASLIVVAAKKGELGVISRGGKSHQRWQHKPTAKGTARIWFYVQERTVLLEQVHTSHPNETK